LDLGALAAGFVTGLREGFEAALIIAILMAYLVRTGHRDQMPKIWAGAGLAGLLSLAIGTVVFQIAGELPSPYEQYFEATAMVVAAAVVTLMLFWMRRASMAMRGELQAALDRTIAAGGALGLAVLAFTAVIREGIETSIFLVGQATSATTSASSLVVGALIGLATAIVIGWLFYTGARRIDLRVFFRWTGIALIFIAAGLLSAAMHELIEVSVITFGTAPVFNISGLLPAEAGIGQFLRAILGYSDAPELTTLVVYLAYLATVLTLYLRPIARPVPPPARVEPPSSTETARS